MNPGTIIAIVIVSLIIDLILAKFMARAADLKGYGDESAPFWLTFLLGFIGCLYVIALPDLELRKKTDELKEINKKILEHYEDKPVEESLPEI